MTGTDLLISVLQDEVKKTRTKAAHRASLKARRIRSEIQNFRGSTLRQQSAQTRPTHAFNRPLYMTF